MSENMNKVEEAIKDTCGNVLQPIVVSAIARSVLFALDGQTIDYKWEISYDKFPEEDK